MGYPNYPNNRLIVNGVDLTTEYRMILSDGYKLEPPEPKIYTVDIPGGNGVIDLTEALNGEIAYNNRKQEFTFYIIGDENFEETKTKVSNFLHGKSFDYKMTMDPNYTYHGRFTVSSYVHSSYTIGIVGCIVVSIEADPYKRKGTHVKHYNSTNGIVAYPISGRKMVQPRFEFSDETLVIFNNKRYVMPAGTYIMEDVWFKEGGNEIFFMSTEYKSHISHKEMMQYTHGQIGSMKPIFKWFEGIRKYYVSNITLEPKTDPISGVVTFTATDESGKQITSSVDLGDKSLVRFGDVCDSLVIEGDTARLIRRLQYKIQNGVGAYVEDVVPTVFTFPFEEIFSNDAPITNLTHNTSGTLTYKTDSINTERLFITAKNEHYMTGGEYSMTHAQMKNYRISQLKIIDTEKRVPVKDKNEVVYLDYEWSDL